MCLFHSKREGARLVPPGNQRKARATIKRPSEAFVSPAAHQPCSWLRQWTMRPFLRPWKRTCCRDVFEGGGSPSAAL
jgi:hypothetical protein